MMRFLRRLQRYFKKEDRSSIAYMTPIVGVMLVINGRSITPAATRYERTISHRIGT